MKFIFFRYFYGSLSSDLMFIACIIWAIGIWANVIQKPKNVSVSMIPYTYLLIFLAKALCALGNLCDPHCDWGHCQLV